MAGRRLDMGRGGRGAQWPLREAGASGRVRAEVGGARGLRPTCLAVVAEEALWADAQVGPSAVLAPASVLAGAGVTGVHLWRAWTAVNHIATSPRQQGRFWGRRRAWWGEAKGRPAGRVGQPLPSQAPPVPSPRVSLLPPGGCPPFCSERSGACACKQVCPGHLGDGKCGQTGGRGAPEHSPYPSRSERQRSPRGSGRQRPLRGPGRSLHFCRAVHGTRLPLQRQDTRLHGPPMSPVHAHMSSTWA